MELRPTLHAISDDTRGWLKAWAGDFTEAEAIEPVGDSLAPHPLVWQLGHLAYHVGQIGALRKRLAKPRVG